MLSLAAIAENRDSIMSILREKRELRRELVSFLTDLEAVWKGMPSDLDQASKFALLTNIVEKGMTETCHGLDVLDRHVDSIIEGYKVSVQTLRAELLENEENTASIVKMRDTKIAEQQQEINNLTQSLEKAKNNAEHERAQFFELAENSLTKVQLCLERWGIFGHGKDKIIELKVYIDKFLEKRNENS